MANLKKVVVVLLVITLVLSAVSVVFNLMIYNLKNDQPQVKTSSSSSSNLGNVGFVVEGNQNLESVEVSNGE